MKIAIINDTHFGARNDNQVFADYFKKFYDNVFFPYLIENDIKTIFVAGDLIDRRKYINFVTLNHIKETFLEPCYQNGIEVHIAVGNHDTYYKNTNKVNSVRSLFADSKYTNLHIYEDEPVEFDYDGTKVMLAPWIAADNYEASVKAFKETDAQILFAHLEIQGFEMLKGQVCTHGFDKKDFSKFDAVYSGHFHHPSTYDNICYMGAPYEMNWADYDGKRGFHIFETTDRSMTFVKNPYQIFQKIFYDDTNMTIEDVANLDAEGLTNTYVKVIIKNKTNPYIFDLFLDRIQQAGATDIKVVEDHMNLDMIDEDDLIDEAQDTHTILNQYVDSIETQVSKDKIKKMITDLYQEAMNL
jgi:DNA repair exonuclease SbcCD nuclease subunit